MSKLYCIIFIIFLSGYFTLSDQQGVDNLWRVEENLNNIQKDKTTQTEIIELFGPPSQIINIENSVIFYYLLQKEMLKINFSNNPTTITLIR